MQKLSLSKIAVAISLCYAPHVFADIQSANSNTQVSRHKGVEIVNIANPSSSGLSHNQYNKFNVDKSGAVLNNAQQTVKTQLAGEIAQNPHLKNSAKVILNEVVSRNPSTLSGKQEIAGKQADYVLANPNGIAVNDGAGFINTPRASLVVGKPKVNGGKLNGYTVDNENALTKKGRFNAKDTAVDLIAPTIDISGSTEAKEINAVLGRNEISRDETGKLSVKALAPKGKVLDGKVAGSMQAGRIRIHSTDDRATISASNAQINAKEFSIQAGNAKLAGEVVSTAKTDASNTVEGRKVKVARTNHKSTQQFNKTTVNADQVIVAVENKLDINAAEIKAKEVVLAGGATHFDTTTTTNASSKETNQSKGLWYRNERDSERSQTVHRTTISGDSVKVVATKEKVTGQAVKIDAKEVALSGKKGVELKGAVETTHREATANFKNETARLKTGSSVQRVSEQRYVASEINSKGNLVLAGDDVNLAGVKAQVDGDLLVANQGSVKIGAEVSQNSAEVSDKQKFWGGIAGAKSLSSKGNSVTQNGADITVKGKAYIEADKGVTISGSRVVAGNGGEVVAKSGGLTIDDVQNVVEKSDSSRKGTIFNITKARESSYSHTSTSQGSTVKSDSNLQLVAKKNIEVVGSQLQAGEKLSLNAGGKVKVQAGENHEQVHSESAGFTTSFSGKINKPELDKAGLIEKLKSDAVGLLLGVTQPKDLLESVKGSVVKPTAEAGVGVSIYKKSSETDRLTHSASQLSGGNVAVNAGNVAVVGSQVTATRGDLSVKAKNIHTATAQDRTNTAEKATTASLKAGVKVTESSVTSTFSAGVEHKQSQSQASTAQASQLSAKNDVNLTANRIVHQGSQLTAGNNVAQTANVVSQESATNTLAEHKKNVNVGVALTTSINKEKAINGSLALNAEGGRENSLTQKAQATSVVAGNNVVTKAQQVLDVGTQYQAGQNVDISANRHELLSAQNQNHSDKLSAGVGVTLSASTKDLNTVDASVAVSAKFQQQQASGTAAQKASVQANNVHLTSQQLHSQADISAQNDLTVKANQATFSHSQNTATSSGGGFEAKVGVGALVIPVATAAIPSVEVSAKANGNSANSLQAVASTLQANNVVLDVARNLSLNGTNVNANNQATLSAKQVSVSAAENSVHSVNAGAGVGVKLGAKAGSLGLNGDFNVQHENSQTHTGVQLNAENVAITAPQGIQLSGVTSTSQHLSLATSNGNLVVTAPQNNVQKTNVGASLALNGGVANNQWTPSGGSAAVNVDVVRNQTHTETTLNTQIANLNVAGTTALTGSNINAQSVTGSVNNLFSTGVTDKVRETSVSLSANGSGKPTAYTDENWQASAKKDWDSGTIAGVKAEVAGSVGVVRKQSNTQAGINAVKNALKVSGHLKNTAATAPEQNTNVKVTGKVNTNIHQMGKEAVNNFRNNKTPFVQVSRQ